MNNFLILMSGGTTPVINSTLAEFKSSKKKNKKSFFWKPGLDGALENKFIDLSNLSLTKIKHIRDMLCSHFTGTSRLKKLNNSEIFKLKSILSRKKFLI